MVKGEQVIFQDSRHSPAQGGPGNDFSGGKNAGQPSGRNNKTSAVFRSIAGVVLGVVVLMMYVGTVALLSRTLMPAWLPWTVALAAALATGLPFGQWWRILTGSRKRPLNYCMHVAVITGILSFAVVASNDSGAGKKPFKTEVTVEKLYRETRHHTKRVSRRHYTRGEAYQVYFAKLRFDGGQSRDVQIKKPLFDRLSAGKAATVETHKGLLGFDVFEPSTLAQPGMGNKRKTRPGRRR